MSSAYDRVKGGALKFKGSKALKQKKEKKRKREADTDEDKEVEVPIITGEGRIVTSGKHIHGFDTTFKDQCEPGDLLVVMHPTTLVEESRVIVGCLSQRSMSIQDEFPRDLISTTAYRIKKESVLLKEKAEKRAKKEGREEIAQDDVSRALQKQLEKRKNIETRTITVREKKGMWGYRTVTKVVNKDSNNEDLLDERCGQASDHWCK